MIQQVIKYSDGTETVIDYRGVIENGVLTPDVPEAVEEAKVEEIKEEVINQEAMPQNAEGSEPEAEN